MELFILYSKEEKDIILNIAKQSIANTLQHKPLPSSDLNLYPDKLQEKRACFVTLLIDKQLRGCIGSLVAQSPLILDIIRNAVNAAFNDPRFPAVNNDDFKKLEIEVSILSTPETMHFNSEQELLNQIKPGIDGLILSDQGHRGTFLPSVWEQLPDPKLFLSHLKNKAGLPADYWSNTIKIERYKTEVIS